MDFTNPLALWLLALVPLPLLLTRRRTPVRRVVSALFLWRAAVHPAGESVARRPRRRGWRTAVQMACIGAIVAALSGPKVTMRRGTTALVFDVSASMAARDGGATRLTTAQSRARVLVQALSASRRVLMIAAASSPRELGEWSAADPRLRTALEKLTPSAGTGDLVSAIERAARAPGVDTVVVFSDAAAAAPPPSAEKPAVQWVQVGRAAENTAVTRIAARQSVHGGRAGQVLVAVRNYGSNPRDTGVEVAVDGRVVHNAPLRLAPGREESLFVPLADLGQVITARVTGDDALPLDDARSAAVHRAMPLRVAFAGPRGSFLHRALEVNPDVDLRLYDATAAGAELDRAWSTGEIDVAACERCGVPPALAPALVAMAPSTETLRAPVVLASAAHPVAASLEPGDALATAGGRAMVPAGAEVILRVGGVPAATAVEHDGRRSVELRFDLSQHDFALSPAFPILIANAIGWLGEQGALPAEATAGEPVAIPRRGIPASMVRALGPDGRARDLRHLAGQSLLADTGIAGQYRITLAGSERRVVVNPAVDTESDLSAPQTVTLDRTSVAAASAGMDVATAPWLSLVALALLAVDWRFRMGRTS